MAISSPYTSILAPNASSMTGSGTNTLVIGSGVEGASVIDPAEDNPDHLEAIIKAGEARGGLKRILITHGHADHTGGAATLRKHLGIYIYAFSRQGTPIADEEVPNGMIFPAGNDTLRAIYTPGHRFDHLCFYLDRQKILFSGDLIAGTGTVVIIPPEGDMLDYLHSLEHLKTLDLQEIVPAHGPPIRRPQEKISEYITHRLQREQQILTILQLTRTGQDILELVHKIYYDVDPVLHPLAARSVEAHLIKLEREGRVQRLTIDRWICP